MNAVPPKGQMPARDKQAEDAHVHLTISFEDEDPSEAAGQSSGGDPAASWDEDAAAARAPDERWPDEPQAAESPKAGAKSRARERAATSAILPQFAEIELSLTVEVGSLSIALKDLVSQVLTFDYLGALAVSIAFLSASQDVVFDAYRADLLEPAERGAGAAVSVLGYRLAMLVSGGLALILAAHAVAIALLPAGWLGVWHRPARGRCTGSPPGARCGKARPNCC
jgi:flagellar motor switch/type III secretory pathway protein FliN